MVWFSNHYEVLGPCGIIVHHKKITDAGWRMMTASCWQLLLLRRTLGRRYPQRCKAMSHWVPDSRVGGKAVIVQLDGGS